MGIFGGKNNEQAANSNAQTENSNNGQQPELKAEAKKTIPDEGKTFDKDTAFVCVQDCFINMTRYHRGETVTGRKCPPHFVVKPQSDEKDEE